MLCEAIQPLNLNLGEAWLLSSCLEVCLDLISYTYGAEEDSQQPLPAVAQHTQRKQQPSPCVCAAHISGTTGPVMHVISHSPTRYHQMFKMTV